METKPTKIRWVLGVFLFVLGFVAYMDRVNLSVAGPMIMEEFHFDKVQFGMIAIRYGWQWAISATAFIGVIGVGAWFLVRPDQPLVITSLDKANKAA